jgi:hypothetical protein
VTEAQSFGIGVESVWSPCERAADTYTRVFANQRGARVGGGQSEDHPDRDELACTGENRVVAAGASLRTPLYK